MDLMWAKGGSPTARRMEYMVRPAAESIFRFMFSIKCFFVLHCLPLKMNIFTAGQGYFFAGDNTP
jgi:hypothetical protein